MYKQLLIEYSSPNNDCDPITLCYNLFDTPPARRWIAKVQECLNNNYVIDEPTRFYGFDDYQTEKNRAITSINNCIDTINNYQPNFITKRVTDTIDQDTLNYLHHIFEVYHGLLDQPHDFYIGAPDNVQKALSQLNIEVHRCESFVGESGRKIMPRHIVTWFQMNRNSELQLEDYNYFTDNYEFGTVYILYVEIGKTLEDLATDNDQYIGEDAYKPFRHYTGDFVVRFFGTTPETYNSNRIKLRTYYDNNKEFFDSRRLPLAHPYNRPGNIPVAKLATFNFNMEDLRKRQMVTKVTLI